MCTSSTEYLDVILKEQKCNITIRPEDVSFWVVITDRDLFSCLPIDCQRYLISTPSEDLVANTNLTDLIDKRVFNDYYHIITEESQIEIVSDDTVLNEGAVDYKLIDSRVPVLLSLLRSLTDSSLLSDVLDCTIWFIGSPDRLFQHLVTRFGNSIIQALVDLQLRGYCIQSTLDIVKDLTALKALKMRMNMRNTSELLEKHGVWISDLQNYLAGNLSHHDSVHVIGFVSELCFVLRLYRNTLHYDRYLLPEQVQLINILIYRLNSAVVSVVLKHAFTCLRNIENEELELITEFLLYIKQIVRRVKLSVKNTEDFIALIKEISSWRDGTFIIDVLLKLITSSCTITQSSSNKEGLHILILSLDILNYITYVPKSPEIGEEIVEKWASELQRWRNEILYNAVNILTKIRSILLVEKCSKTLKTVLLAIPDAQNDAQNFWDDNFNLSDEKISEMLMNCIKTLLDVLSANQIECPLQKHDKVLFSDSVPSSENRSFSLETMSDLSSNWQRACWMFNNDKDEYVRELKRRLLKCLTACIALNEDNTGSLTRLLSQKIIQEVRQPVLKCILNLSSDILNKSTVTEITRLAFTLVIRIPKYLSNIENSEENIDLCEMNAQMKPIIPRLLQFAVKHDHYAMAYLTMWYTSNYFNINMANLHQSVYLSNDYLKDTDSQSVINSVDDFEREAGAIVTFLEKSANFGASQHNLAMEKLRAHTKVMLSGIKDPKARCHALIQCQGLWEKLSLIFLKVPFGSHAVGIFFDIIHEISRINDKKIANSKWRDSAIGIILKVSGSNGLRLRDIIQNALHVHRISDRNKVCYISAVKMISSLVSGPPYFYPLFLDKQICLALLGNLKFIRESEQSYKNEELDEVVAGTARILCAWGCNYPDDCLKAFDKTSRSLILQFDTLEIREFHKRYLEMRAHKCSVLKSMQKYKLQLFQLYHYCDCVQQWFMIFFGLFCLIAEIRSHQFNAVDFILDLALFLLSFSSMIYINYLSFEARMRHNRETFTTDTVIWEGKQPDDGSTTLKSRMRHYLHPFSNSWTHNLYCFLHMRVILDVKEILHHKPQLVNVLKSKMRNFSTLKLYLKLSGIAGVILQSLVIANNLLAVEKVKDIFPKGEDANTTIHDIKAAHDTFELLSAISTSPLKSKIELLIMILTLLWSLYSTGNCLATYERNSGSSSVRHFNLLILHHIVAIICRLTQVILAYTVSGVSTLLLVAGHSFLSLLLNFFSPHKYHDPALDEEKQKSTLQRPILLALKRAENWSETVSIVVRLLLFSVSETLIVSVRHPIDMLEGIYHEWHEKTVFGLAPTFLLQIVEMTLLTVMLQNSHTFVIVSIANISSWIPLVIYLLTRTQKGDEWKSKEGTFCDEISEECDDGERGV